MLPSPIYMVPYDFSEVSEKATRLALDLAEANDGFVLLIHVVKKISDKYKTDQKFIDVIKSLNKEDQNRIDFRTVPGDLFEDMGKFGIILNTELIVMGTHGAKGFQKVFGSNAVKMISNSFSPFLITQGKKTVDKIKNIVMPFSFEKKTIQIVKIASSIAKRFNATIHLVGYHDKDEWLERHLKGNQTIVSNYLKENGVNFKIHNIDSKKNFNKELLNYAKEVDADLLAAAYFSEGIIRNPKSFIQFMIENELHLPLLTINAQDTGSATGNIAIGV